ncbi:ATP-dependent zinc metalloprotease FtsH [Verrucomicrobiota bacterium]
MENKHGQPKTPERPESNPSKHPGTSPMPIKVIVVWVIIFAMILFTYRWFTSQKDAYKEIPYLAESGPDFVQLVENGEISQCKIMKDPAAPYIRGELISEKEIDGQKVIKFKVSIADPDEERKRLMENKVPFVVKNTNPLITQMIGSVLPIVLIFGILYFLFMRQIRAAGHGAMSFGKSRAKMLNRDKNKVTFKEVAGVDEAKEEVQEIIDFLKDPKRFQKLGGRIPKGVMLMGPPGTGKTLLAKAIAGEADVPFFSISGSDFVEMFVGVGASRVRDMFEQGKKSAPCIIFIDEIDAVGRSRFTGIGGGHDEREQTLNALLVEMDGFDTQEGVIILAATNRPDVLDPALLRHGRFDRQIVLDLPMIDGREAILKIHSKKIKLQTEKDLRRIARGTPGFSGADLENLLNEAALLAARQDKDAVDLEDMEEARDKVRWGRERRSRKLDEKDKKLTAYHEAGHALVQIKIKETEPLHKVTIIPRGMFLGATMSLPDKDRYLEGKKKLLGDLAVFMGGRVAEEIILEDITSGASSDLKEATRIARLMICSWGMSESLGPQTFGEHQELMFLGREINKTQDYSEETARKIDAEISKLLRDSHKCATRIITKHRDKLELMVSMLLERETLDGKEVEEIVEYGRILSGEERDEINRKKEEKNKPADNDQPESDNKEIESEDLFSATQGETKESADNVEVEVS